MHTFDDLGEQETYVAHSPDSLTVQIKTVENLNYILRQTTQFKKEVKLSYIELAVFKSINSSTLQANTAVLNLYSKCCKHIKLVLEGESFLIGDPARARIILRLMAFWGRPKQS